MFKILYILLRHSVNNLVKMLYLQVSDEVDLNIDTFEPEEDAENAEKDQENNEKSSKEGCKEDHRTPMRKPAFLVQYWIDTGNPPYNMLLDKDEPSETTCLSLTENEIEVPLQMSPISTVVNNDNISRVVNSCSKLKSDSSCSSVDTAAYILSNVNVTKKVDTLAIIEGAKSADKSVDDYSGTTDFVFDNVTCTGRVDDAIQNDNDDADTDIPMNAASIHSQETTDTSLFNATQRILLQSPCEETKNNQLVSKNKSLNVQAIDILSIFQQFDETSKRLSQDSKADHALNENETSDKSGSHNEVSANDITETVIEEDASLTLLHRKKLYTDRNSPVDLMLIKKHSMNKISEARKTLHPALDPECTFKRKSYLSQRGKSKRCLSCKNISDQKVNKSESTKKRSSVLSRSIVDANNIEDKGITKDANQNSIVEMLPNNSSEPNNELDIRQKDVSLQDNNDTNISIKAKTWMRDSAPLTPVLLEQIVLPLNQHASFDSVKDNDAMQQESHHMQKNSPLKSTKQHTCNVETLDLETVDSDESTIIICKCKQNGSISFSNQHFLDSISEDDFTSDNLMEKDDVTRKNDVIEKDTAIGKNKEKTLSNHKDLKSAYISQMKEAHVILERLSPSQYLCRNHARTTEEPQDLNTSNATRQEKILNNSKTHSSLKVSKKKNIKLSEIRIVLERLPANLYVKRNNISNTNDSTDSESNSSDGTNNSANAKNNDRSRNISRKVSTRKTGSPIEIPEREKRKRRRSFRIVKIDNNYSGHENPTLSKIKTNFVSEYKDHVNQERSKYSILAFISSDEDELVQLIRSSRKRMKISRNDETGKRKHAETNLHRTKLIDKDQDYSSENSDLKIQSSRRTSKVINKSVNKKTRSKRSELKSHNNSRLTDSVQAEKSGTVLSSLRDVNNIVENSINRHRKEKRRTSFLNLNKTVNNDSGKRSRIRTKKNEMDCKDDTHGIVFQTKMFYTDSSDSERSNSYTITTRKSVTQLNKSTRTP